MKLYTGPGSPILGYEDDKEDRITLHYSGGTKYTYSYKSCGKENVENMKELARENEGLMSYVNKNCHGDYEK